MSGDVLVENLNTLDFTRCHDANLSGCIGVFTSGQVFGEWLVAFGNHLEVGAGVGFYSDSTPSVYDCCTHPGPDFAEIRQEISLRITPVSAVVRFLAGRPGGFQPYVGAGVAALNFRYTEAGEFIDYTDPNAVPLPTYTAHYTTSSTTFGQMVLAGMRIPIGGDIWGLTMEWRHQWGAGNTGGASNGFLANKIDLGGDNINFGVLVRF